MNNLSSYCVLVDAKIRASDKDLPVKNMNANIIFLDSTYLVNKIKVLKVTFNLERKQFVVNSKSLIHKDLTAVNNPQSGASASTVTKNHDIHKSSYCTFVFERYVNTERRKDLNKMFLIVNFFFSCY